MSRRMFSTLCDLSVIDISFVDHSRLRADLYVLKEHPRDRSLTSELIAAGIAQTILSCVPPNLLYRYPHWLE
jgi:hypothetical protein